MLKNKVVKLMLEDTQLFLVSQSLKKLRVVEHDKVTSILVNLDASSRECSGRTLVNPARKRGKEGLIHQKAGSVLV
jgi:hypothetical protein